MEWRDDNDNWKTWKVNYGKLKDIALKIDAINADFYQMMLQNGLSPGGKSGLLSVAWQRICGIQNPSLKSGRTSLITRQPLRHAAGAIRLTAGTRGPAAAAARRA